MRQPCWTMIIGLSACVAWIAVRDLRTPVVRASGSGPAVQAITILQPAGLTPGFVDTQRQVLAPDGSPINKVLGSTITDEHSSVLPPGSLGNNTEYLFFVASGSREASNGSIGALPLAAINGKDPDFTGQWTLGPASSGVFFLSAGCAPPLLNCTVFGDSFLAPHKQHITKCPAGDTTFDLNYAAPGSVVPDPSAPGHALMIYEGVNGCIGPTKQHPINIGIATSTDNGRTWPTYCGAPSLCGGTVPPAYEFYPLPLTQNPSQGPDKRDGAWGAQVCRGNDCSGTNADTYGRYRVLSDASIPSAFVDDVAGGLPYLYIVHQIHTNQPGSGGLTVSRVHLNRGTARLTKVENWDGTGFCPDPNRPGCSTTPEPILKPGKFAECGAAAQTRWQGQISYVDATKQYLLTFVCESHGDPASGQPGTGKGDAWFWATTSDLSTQQWSTPATDNTGAPLHAQEVTGTWNPIATCDVYNGWYPTWMSPSPTAAGHLSSSGYVFYMWGNLGKCSTPFSRQYLSRKFTMTIK